MCHQDKQGKAGNNESMEQPKTYIATIDVTFEAYEEERPRSIAKYMADSFNGMRGANLHTCGELRQVKLIQHEVK